MADKYIIRFEGKEIECPSLAAAERLLMRLGKGVKSPDIVRWSAHEFNDFVGRLRYFQRRALGRLIKGKAKEVTDVELREAIPVGTNQGLAGVLSGLTKVAAALDIEPERVYQQKTVYKSGKPQRTYRATSALYKAAGEADWPSEEDLKMTEEEYLDSRYQEP